MRWTRILKYTLVLYVVTFVVGFAYGLVEGFVEAASGSALAGGPALAIDLFMGLTMFATVSSVFTLMAYRTAGRRAPGAVHLVALSVWLTSFPLNVVLLGQPAATWLMQGAAFMEFCVLCGLGAGVGIRALVGLLREPKDRPAVATPEAVATGASRHAGVKATGGSREARMEIIGDRGPGFAPAAGERTTAAWTALAACGGATVALAVPLIWAALALALVLEVGAADVRSPALDAGYPPNQTSKEATPISHSTGADITRFENGLCAPCGTKAAGVLPGNEA